MKPPGNVSAPGATGAGSHGNGCASDPTPSPLLNGRPLACPLCGDAARLDPAARLLVCGNPECAASDVLDEREVLAALEAAGRRWWQSLDGFLRDVLREPVAARAARRLTRDLLEHGIAPAVVEQLVRAVNAQRDRPALLPELEEALLAGVADLERRRGVAA